MSAAVGTAVPLQVRTVCTPAAAEVVAAYAKVSDVAVFWSLAAAPFARALDTVVTG